MVMVCKICSHPDRLEIDRLLVSGRTKSSIAREYSVSENSLLGHSQKHLSRQMITAVSVSSRLSTERLLDTVEGMLAKTQSILENSSRETVQLMAIGQLQKICQMLGNWRLEHQKMQIQQDQFDQANAIDLPEITDDMTPQEAAAIYRKHILMLKSSPRGVVILPAKETVPITQDNTIEQDRREARRQARRLRLEMQDDVPDEQPEYEEPVEEISEEEAEIEAILAWKPSEEYLKRNQPKPCRIIQRPQ